MFMEKRAAKDETTEGTEECSVYSTGLTSKAILEDVKNAENEISAIVRGHRGGSR